MTPLFTKKVSAAASLTPNARFSPCPACLLVCSGHCNEALQVRRLQEQQWTLSVPEAGRLRPRRTQGGFLPSLRLGLQAGCVLTVVPVHEFLSFHVLPLPVLTGHQHCSIRASLMASL